MKAHHVITQAIDRCGSQAALAAKLGVTQQTVSYWIRKGVSKLPAQHVIPLESLTGISRRMIRPDIYPHVGESPASQLSIGAAN